MSAKQGALYVCYFPISDPLVESQVLAYLKGLAALGFRIHLVTFELSHRPAEEIAIRERLRREGIVWSCLYYRTGAGIARKAFEGLRGVLRLIRVVVGNNLRVLHARAHPPAMMAYPVARLFGLKLLFDVRGLIADEYADIGHWSRTGLSYRGVKLAERFLLRHADAVVFLTQAVVRDLRSRGSLRDRDLEKVTVIPCCVEVPAKVAIESPREFALAYVGKLGSWYLHEEILQLFVAIRRLRPKAKLFVITQSATEALQTRLRELGLSKDDVWVGKLDHSQVAARLEQATAAVAFYKPGYSKVATSPTKVGEYLSAGLPVVINGGIGDCDALLGRNEVGVSIKDFSAAELQGAAQRLIALAETPGVRDRCRSVAFKELDLRAVGVERYRSIYARLNA